MFAMGHETPHPARQLHSEVASHFERQDAEQHKYHLSIHFRIDDPHARLRLGVWILCSPLHRSAFVLQMVDHVLRHHHKFLVECHASVQQLASTITSRPELRMLETLGIYLLHQTVTEPQRVVQKL